MSVETYDAEINFVRSKSGEWVKYEDHVEIVSELEKRIEQLQGEVDNLDAELTYRINM